MTRHFFLWVRWHQKVVWPTGARKNEWIFLGSKNPADSRLSVTPAAVWFGNHCPDCEGMALDRASEFTYMKMMFGGCWADSPNGKPTQRKMARSLKNFWDILQKRCWEADHWKLSTKNFLFKGTFQNFWYLLEQDQNLHRWHFRDRI